MVKPLSYEDVGHENNADFPFPALSPDYVETDIGMFNELSATVFGYQIDEESALKMSVFLLQFITDSVQSRRSKAEIDKLR